MERGSVSGGYGFHGGGKAYSYLSRASWMTAREWRTWA